jgi:hypothetical protein
LRQIEGLQRKRFAFELSHVPHRRGREATHEEQARRIQSALVDTHAEQRRSSKANYARERGVVRNVKLEIHTHFAHVARVRRGTVHDSAYAEGFDPFFKRPQIEVCIDVKRNEGRHCLNALSAARGPLA